MYWILTKSSSIVSFLQLNILVERVLFFPKKAAKEPEFTLEQSACCAHPIINLHSQMDGLCRMATPELGGGVQKAQVEPPDREGDRPGTLKENWGCRYQKDKE